MTTPICKDCHKPIKGDSRIIVNQKTLKDYRLCPTCYFFKFQNQANNAKITKNLKPQAPAPTLDEYFKLKGLARYYVIKNITDIKVLKQIINLDKAVYRIETCKRRISKLARG